MTMGMTSTLTRQTLRQQTRAWLGTGAVSEELRGTQFQPAFKDFATGKTYLARFADGTPAPMHLLDGLPDELVVGRDAGGHVAALKSGVVAGFVRLGCFYTREETAAHFACTFALCRSTASDGPDPGRSRTHDDNRGPLPCLAGR